MNVFKRQIVVYHYRTPTLPFLNIACIDDNSN